MTATTVLDAAAVRDGTPWRALVEAIGAIVCSSEAAAPDRHVHDLVLPGGHRGSLLLMPSWIPGDAVGVKAVTFVPTNAGTPVPTINAAYLLFSGRDGRLLAVLDGDELTARRTAATSALAARHLSREDAERVLVVGTGQLARHMAHALAEVRDLELVEIWGRRPEAAQEIARQFSAQGMTARASTDLADSLWHADIVTCVTGATTPIVHGSDLREGCHLDLVGSFRPDMREADDEAVLRSTIFVDTAAGALHSGDLAQPIGGDVIGVDDLVADLADLVAGRHPGRTSDDEITLFKSAGFALADLAAARLALANQPAPGR